MKIFRHPSFEVFQCFIKEHQRFSILFLNFILTFCSRICLTFPQLFPNFLSQSFLNLVAKIEWSHSVCMSLLGPNFFDMKLTRLFFVCPPHPHCMHHRNFDPGICEVVGSTKYGSFLSNFRGILALQSIQDPQLHAPHQFPNIFPQSSSISDTPPQFRSSRDY